MNSLRLMTRTAAFLALGALGGINARGQAVSLQGGNNYISQHTLTGALAISHEVMGGRMKSADKAQISLVGSVTDAKGTRNAQIIVQAPGHLSYREDQGRAVTFDGNQAQTKSGSLAADDQVVFESLLAHLPDAMFLQVAAGGGVRRIGSHFRTDDGKAKNYTGPYWTVIAFSPKSRQGLSLGSPLQQQLFIAVDESTGLLSEVRSVVNLGPGQHKVTQTQFNSWIQQGNQWFPGKITRLENGVQTLTFQTQQATTGPAIDAVAFKP